MPHSEVTKIQPEFFFHKYWHLPITILVSEKILINSIKLKMFIIKFKYVYETYYSPEIE